VRPLRLVLITRRFWPLVGGEEKAMAQLAAELASHQCRVTVLTVRWHPRWPSEFLWGDVPVLRLPQVPRTGWSTVQYMLAIARWLRKHRDDFDLVYVAGLRHEAYAALKTLRGRQPVVLRAEGAGREGDCLWQLDARCGRRIKQRCLRADALVGSTPAVHRELVAAGYPRTRTYYLRDGVPIPPPRDWDRQAAAREALGTVHPAMKIPQWTPLVVYAGRLSEDRGLDELLEAWETVALGRPQARLWLVGTGPYEARLRRQVDERNLTGRVLLTGAFDNIDELLMAADLFVLPSREGKASLTLLEAMAAGLPVVATDLPDHRQLTAGRSALLVPPGDPPALAEALARLLEEPDLGAELGAAARQRAVAEFSLARMAQEHLKLFESLVLGAEAVG
jgi:glycosyltransferase involved in cell wall biosynthesis